MGRESYQVRIVAKLAPLALLAAAAVVACGDESPAVVNPGGLVHADIAPTRTVDVKRAAEDIGELVRALSMPHHRVSELLGAHTFAGESEIEVTSEGAVTDHLAVSTSIVMGEDGAFSATLENSEDYGRGVIFTGNTLYLRPRYGTYLMRPPQTESEPGQIRDQIFGDVGAYFALLARAASATDQGTEDRGGRSARRIVLSKAEKMREPKPGDLPQRAWRADVTVTDVSGEVILDSETGVPLSASVTGKVAFSRDGRDFEMTVTAKGEITDVGVAHPIAAPPADQAVPPHSRPRELAERKKLLRGIAPPPRRAPTPENPTGIARPSAVR